MIDWLIVDANFDETTYFFSKLSEEEIAKKVNKLSDELAELLEEKGIEQDRREMCGVEASGVFVYDAKSKKLRVYDWRNEKFSDDPKLISLHLEGFTHAKLLSEFKSCLDIGCISDGFKNAPFDVHVLRHLLAMDTQGLYWDGKKFHTSPEFLKKLEPFDDLNTEEEAVEDEDNSAEAEEAGVADLIMNTWETVKDSPFKRMMFKDEVLSGKDELKRLFEAVIKNPALDDEELRTQLKMKEQDFTRLKYEINSLVDKILMDSSDS